MALHISFSEIIIYFSLFIIFIICILNFLPRKGIPNCKAIELPFFGHFFSISADTFHIKLTEWCKLSNSGLCQFNLFGEKIIVVSNYEGVKEALITKSDEFSGRPLKELVLMVTRNGKDLAFGDFNERLIYKKKMFMKHIKIGNVVDMNVETSTFDVLDSYNESVFSKLDEVDLSKLFENLTFDIIVAVVSVEKLQN